MTELVNANCHRNPENVAKYENFCKSPGGIAIALLESSQAN
ncbi:hypothetical protein [Nostoc sp. FACHB-280]|nr:hypothetical protein [Nostoc sp. FACHB-280]